jgi:hypothetical protein
VHTGAHFVESPSFLMHLPDYMANAGELVYL